MDYVATAIIKLPIIKICCMWGQCLKLASSIRSNSLITFIYPAASAWRYILMFPPYKMISLKYGQISHNIALSTDFVIYHYDLYYVCTVCYHFIIIWFIYCKQLCTSVIHILWKWLLTRLSLDKMAAISQTILSHALPWMKSFVFWSKFHCSLFLRVNLIITQHWFR